MKVNMSLRPEFDELYDHFVATKPGLLRIDGIHPDQLDIGLVSYQFFNEKLASITTDTNSNGVEDYSPSSYRAHCSNAQMKLLGFFTLWHYCEKRFGRDFADEALYAIWNGDLYFHDAHGVKIQMPYCYAFSLMNMVLEGRPYGSSPNTPPKHRRSFLSQVDKLIGDLSKQFAGAVAPSDFFLWYAYFAKQDGLTLSGFNSNDHKREMIQDFQGLVCLLNEPSRAEGESPFTNFGIYDETGLENLFGHIMYPDGTMPDLDYIMQIQKAFCEWFQYGDPLTGFPYRFPVVTINVTTDEHNEFIHPDFVEWVSKITRTKANFNVHFGDKAKLAMCMSSDTEILTEYGWKLFRDLERGERVVTLNTDTGAQELQEPLNYTQYRYDGIMHRYHNSAWNNYDTLVTPNHEMLCYKEGKGYYKRQSQDLLTRDALVRCGGRYNGDGRYDRYAKLIGFFIGDGCIDRHKLSFHLSRQRKIEYILKLVPDADVCDKLDGRKLIRFPKPADVPWESFYTDTKQKTIPMDIILGLSKQGIEDLIDGLMNSDGSGTHGKSTTLYYDTKSKQLANDVCTVFVMAGYQATIKEKHPKTGYSANSVTPLYRVRLIKYGTYSGLNEREDVEYHDDVYCVEVPNHTIIVRRNGITSITGQCCRYENDLSDMGMSPDSFGNGGVNIGSHRVVTINLPRMAIYAKLHGGDVKDYIKQYMEIAAKLLVVHRYDILGHRIEQNPAYLQFFGKLKWFTLNTMFSTFGVTGTYEMCQIAGYDLMTDEGIDWANDVLRFVREQCRSYRNYYNIPFNIEEIPGEQACVALIQKDKLVFDKIQDIQKVLDTSYFYSNQYIPLTMDADITSRLDISGQFMKLISGGGIVHLNVGTRIESDEIMYELMKLAAKSGVNHMAVCYRFGMCKNGHTNIVGQADECPICGEPIVRARNRVIGYYSEESNWHPVRQEHDARYRTFTDVKGDTGE